MGRDRYLVGGILVALGILFLAGQWAGLGGEAVVAAIGIVFLVAYASTRNYGFLVPGGILTGLGLGIIWQARGAGGGAPVVLGLGLGFVAVYVVDRAARQWSGQWWPVIPGAVLTAIGVLVWLGRTGVLAGLGRWWPVLLILLGLWVLLRRQPRPGA